MPCIDGNIRARCKIKIVTLVDTAVRVVDTRVTRIAVVIRIAFVDPVIKQVDRSSVRGDCINRMVGECAGLSAIARARRTREEIERVIGVCSLGGYARRNKKCSGNQNCYEALLTGRIFSARYSAKSAPPPSCFSD